MAACSIRRTSSHHSGQRIPRGCVRCDHKVQSQPFSAAKGLVRVPTRYLPSLGAVREAFERQTYDTGDVQYYVYRYDRARADKLASRMSKHFLGVAGIGKRKHILRHSLINTTLS